MLCRKTAIFHQFEQACNLGSDASWPNGAGQPEPTDAFSDRDAGNRSSTPRGDPRELPQYSNPGKVMATVKDTMMKVRFSVWTAELAVTRLGVSRTTLQNWRRQGLVVCMLTDDCSAVYPAAQFGRLRSDRSQPQPYLGIMDVTALLGKQMTA